MNCLSVFDHLMKLGLDGSIGIIKISTSVILHTQFFKFLISELIFICSKVFPKDLLHFF